MCAVVTVGAVVGPTCGACAARARRWSTAYRGVPKRCAPKSWGLCVHKDNQSGDFCLLCAEKASSSLQISFIRRYFLLLLYTRAQKRASPTALARGNGTASGRTRGPIGAGTLAWGEVAENQPYRARSHGDISLSATRRRAMLGASPRLPPLEP